MIAICEICGHRVGHFDPLKISYPVTGDMFTSPDPAHKYPDPFHHSLGWRDMRCPMCHKRPFIQDDRIKIDGGFFKLREGSNFWCVACQFGTGNAGAWSGHCRSKAHIEAIHG